MAHATNSGSVYRVAASVVTSGATLLMVGYLAHCTQLKSAVKQLGGQQWLLAAPVITYTGAFLLRAIAWRVLSSSCTGIIQLFVSSQSTLMINHISPLKPGEVVRPLLAARIGTPIAEAASATAVARYLDFTALLAIAVLAGAVVSLTTGAEPWLEGLALPGGVIMACGGVLIALRQFRGFGVFLDFLRSRLQVLQHELRQMSSRWVAHAKLWTIPSRVLEAGVIVVAAKALGVELSTAAAIAVTTFTILFQVFHITPGGIGLCEAIVTGALYAYGVPWELGMALAVVTHGLKFAYSHTMALTFTLTALGKLQELNPLSIFLSDSHGPRTNRTSTQQNNSERLPGPNTNTIQGSKDDNNSWPDNFSDSAGVGSSICGTAPGAGGLWRRRPNFKPGGAHPGGNFIGITDPGPGHRRFYCRGPSHGGALAN